MVGYVSLSIMVANVYWSSELGSVVVYWFLLYHELAWVLEVCLHEFSLGCKSLGFVQSLMSCMWSLIWCLPLAVVLTASGLCSVYKLVLLLVIMNTGNRVNSFGNCAQVNTLLPDSILPSSGVESDQEGSFYLSGSVNLSAAQFHSFSVRLAQVPRVFTYPLFNFLLLVLR